MSIWFQAHHLETEFYDQYYQPGAYHEACATTWRAGTAPARHRR